MDYLKRETMNDYTNWDLNCKCTKNNNQMEHEFKRKARRKNKRELKKYLDI